MKLVQKNTSLKKPDSKINSVNNTNLFIKFIYPRKP